MKDDPEPMVGSGTVDDRAERLPRTIRDQSSPNLRPRDSATLILIDRSESVPKVLLGRRHQRHRTRRLLVREFVERRVSPTHI